LRGDQLTRQWKLVNLLSGRLGRSLDQLAAELGVTKRTIQRDIAVLETRFPVFTDERDGVIFWRIMDSTQDAGGLAFTLPELVALYFSRDLLQVLRGSPMQQAIESAIEKIGAHLPASGHDLVRRLTKQTSVSASGWKDYSKSALTIQALERAIRHRLTVTFVHKPLNAPDERTRSVDPYRLWYKDGGLYVIGHDHTKQALRTFAVERIRRVATTNQHFSVPDDFDFDCYTETAFSVHGGEPQLVRIRFSAEQAPYVLERTWHGSQRAIPQEDGSLILEIEVGNLWEVKRWLIGWGADAEVLEPVGLREDCLADLRKLMVKYQGDDE